ncbi:MAG TPA: hypothetical protein VK585_15370 [Jiangellaceae bacterium]|nr:hypothetical protein [Jiangellaceae bacterium]
MATTPGFAELPLYRKLAIGGAVLLFIDLFLPWLSISVEDLDISASANAWDSGLGTLIGILLIVLIAWEVLRLTGNAPEFGMKHDLVTAVLAGVIALLTLFLFFDVLGDTGIGAWLGLILLIVMGYVAYLAFAAAGGREAIDETRVRAPDTGTATAPPPVAEPEVAAPAAAPAAEPQMEAPVTAPEPPAYPAPPVADPFAESPFTDPAARPETPAAEPPASSPYAAPEAPATESTPEQRPDDPPRDQPPAV